MIDVLFSFGPDFVLVRVDGASILFGAVSQGAQMADMAGLRLDQKGVEKEFPDLIGDKDWRLKAVQRFKEKIKTLHTEEERVRYIIEDLKKHNYHARFKQKAGFRREKIDGGRLE